MVIGELSVSLDAKKARDASAFFVVPSSRLQAVIETHATLAFPPFLKLWQMPRPERWLFAMLGYCLDTSTVRAVVKRFQ
jgi:hypothetical protein